MSVTMMPGNAAGAVPRGDPRSLASINAAAALRNYKLNPRLGASSRAVIHIGQSSSSLAVSRGGGRSNVWLTLLLSALHADPRAPRAYRAAPARPQTTPRSRASPARSRSSTLSSARATARSCTSRWATARSARGRCWRSRATRPSCRCGGRAAAAEGHAAAHSTVGLNLSPSSMPCAHVAVVGALRARPPSFPRRHI